MACESGVNLMVTELRLGLPGCDDADQPTTPLVRSNKRSSAEISEESRCGSSSTDQNCDSHLASPPAKEQVVGWPPIRSYRKNSFHAKEKGVEAPGRYVKVSMDGAPYLRKIDLKVYKSYPELLKALENMFKLTIGEYSETEGYDGSEFVPTYEDKDGDWMLLGDVPMDMFISSCKRLRLVRRSEARGLGYLQK